MKPTAEISAGGRTETHDEANSRFRHFCERAQKRRQAIRTHGNYIRRWKDEEKTVWKEVILKDDGKGREERRQDREAHSSSCGLTRGAYKVPTFSTGIYTQCNYVYFKLITRFSTFTYDGVTLRSRFRYVCCLFHITMNKLICAGPTRCLNSAASSSANTIVGY